MDEIGEDPRTLRWVEVLMSDPTAGRQGARSHPTDSCCTPNRGKAGSPPVSAVPIAERRSEVGGRPAAVPQPVEPQPVGPQQLVSKKIRLDGGTFAMGSEDVDRVPGDGESPVRDVTVSPFAIDDTTVTNAQFALFVAATGYRSETESWGWSYVFAPLLPAELRRSSPRLPDAPWWCAVQGADWRHPEGPGSDVRDRGEHPVVQVSWADAATYCRWAGGRLPTEAEWEYAARGGLHQARFAWGKELTPDGEHRCNIWQGQFPSRNTVADGYRATAPVRSYPPNGYGLYEVAGNVWEWTADWWGTEHLASAIDPTGPDSGTARVMRGGSYLCHASYCNRYRVAARSHNDPDSAGGNLGFRCSYPAR